MPLFQQEKILFRKMLYINAARVSQDGGSVVWKNSFISPLFPRESIRDLPSKPDSEKHTIPLFSPFHYQLVTS